MKANVEDMSREQLEDVVIHQSVQLRILQEQVEFLKKEKDELEDQYMELAQVVMTARQVLSC
ncbi:hypothetical protein CHOED_044 [Vibrio phage CHOED]|uniref:hypothetical protein n=1 Tax=Vibrio phage CHOED TaxID=1458716 RepID=UPI00042E25E5|nr:hypothetical protein CHOED_044 [Vibrio phage CHOED]AHK11904.1 hypothetical protein CHOED_044 [Vibrio phage CHOED]